MLTHCDTMFAFFSRRFHESIALIFLFYATVCRGPGGFNDAFAVRVINRGRDARLIFFAGILLPSALRRCRTFIEDHNRGCRAPQNGRRDSHRPSGRETPQRANETYSARSAVKYSIWLL